MKTRNMILIGAVGLLTLVLTGCPDVSLLAALAGNAPEPPDITVTGPGATEVRNFELLDLGDVTGNEDFTFQISNSGDEPLTLETTESDRVMLVNASYHYSIQAYPNASVLEPGESTSFTVRFASDSMGLDFDATVVVYSDDPDESSFVIYLTGFAQI